jgi:hypothetical protein
MGYGYGHGHGASFEARSTEDSSEKEKATKKHKHKDDPELAPPQQPAARSRITHWHTAFATSNSPLFLFVLCFISPITN